MIRRIVTAEREGKSVVVSDGAPARSHAYKHAKGMEWSFAWSTSSPPRFDGAEEPVERETSIFPAVGESRLLVLTIPPDSWAEQPGYDGEAAGAEMAEQMPDMIASMAADGTPPFHRSQTVDYAIVLEGELVVELDDEEIINLKKHDILVQNGARHAWRNPSGSPATVAIVLLGAQGTTD